MTLTSPRMISSTSLRGLFATQRRAEARSFFQLGVRETRVRVRVGRALRQLPEIERALVAGTLSYSRVREITRVATSETGSEWLVLATQLDMRALERRVAGANGDTDAQADAGSVRTAPTLDQGPRVEWTTPAPCASPSI